MLSTSSVQTEDGAQKLVVLSVVNQHEPPWVAIGYGCVSHDLPRCVDCAGHVPFSSPLREWNDEPRITRTLKRKIPANVSKI